MAKAKSSRITRAVYVGYGLLAFAFIAHSIVQVVSACFELERPREGAVSPACVSGVRGLLRAADRAASAAQGRADPGEAREVFTKSLSPEWDEREAVSASCAEDPDVYADVVRARRELESHAVSAAQSTADVAARVGPLRRRLERRLGAADSR